jgi:hypothetical protein
VVKSQLGRPVCKSGASDAFAVKRCDAERYLWPWLSAPKLIASTQRTLEASTTATQQQLTQQIVDESTYLFENRVSQETVNQVQDALMQGMTDAGNTNGYGQELFGFGESTILPTAEQLAETEIETSNSDDCE